MTVSPQWNNLGPGSIAQRALELLATGVSRPAAARTLSVSTRFVVQELTPVRQRLGATTPYTLGSLAIRAGWLGPHPIMDHARQHRTRDHWTRPTTDQREILCLLASGHNYYQIAATLEVSSRTVRRQFRTLAAANGTHGLLPAGALFEALGWHGHQPVISRR